MNTVISDDKTLNNFCIKYIKENLKNSLSENIKYLSEIKYNKSSNIDDYIKFINDIMNTIEPKILNIQNLNNII